MCPQSVRSSTNDRANTSPSSPDFVLLSVGSFSLKYFAAASFPSYFRIRAYLRLDTWCAGITLATAATALLSPLLRKTTSKCLPSFSSASFRHFLNSPMLVQHPLNCTVSPTASFAFRGVLTRPKL